MAKYKMRETPDLRGDGKRVKYPKMVISGQINLRRIARQIAQESSYSEADVLGFVAALAGHIARGIASGHSVKVDGVGIFTARLGLKRGAERESDEGSRRNAMSLEIKGVNFRPDKDLLQEADSHCDLERTKCERYTSARTGREERLAMALDYLHRGNAFLTVWSYAGMTGLSQPIAGRELRTFYTEGLLGIKGRGTHRVYILPQPEQQVPEAEPEAND